MMPDALSLSRSDLPEEIATAIEELIDAEHDQFRKGASNASAWCEQAKVCNQAREALTAAILSRLGEAEVRREEAEDAPSGPGSSPSGPAPTDQEPSAYDPSRDQCEMDWPLRARVWTRTSVEPHEKVLEIVGSINDTFMACRHTQSLAIADADVPGLPERYVCRCDWQAVGPGEIIDDLRQALEDIRDFPDQKDPVDTGEHRRRLAEMALDGLDAAIRLNAEAQETEAQRAETLGSACEGSVAEGHAPALTEAGRLAIKDA
ncbi:hypothetical protein LOK46_10390 [Methylobacterium sp. NMS14P]|uniref:hypothetical protein n=1 Tax=Methylobacterium sp. NMS14P TaxID=2894310 RepID=UPI0023588DEA|nr:hypothetical protein [Methylobacterium sp. NMS14P]WCS27197.1 hypothetical protein LOK46_10390 [Methylobacterium sp. NMS14P]